MEVWTERRLGAVYNIGRLKAGGTSSWWGLSLEVLSYRLYKRMIKSEKTPMTSRLSPCPIWMAHGCSLNFFFDLVFDKRSDTVAWAEENAQYGNMRVRCPFLLPLHTAPPLPCLVFRKLCEHKIPLESWWVGIHWDSKQVRSKLPTSMSEEAETLIITEGQAFCLN